MKAWLLRLHRWVALLFALPLAVVLATGLILSFEPMLVIRASKPGSLDAGKIEQRVHEAQQPQRVAMGDLLPFSMHRRQGRARIAQTLFERSDEQGERCAEFVTDVAEERRLRAIERRQRFGARPLFFVRSRVAQRRRQLVGHEVEKRAVGIQSGRAP